MPDHTRTQKENQNQLYHTLTFSQILHQSNQLDVKGINRCVYHLPTEHTYTQHTYLLYIFFQTLDKEQKKNSFIGFLKFYIN